MCLRYEELAISMYTYFKYKIRTDLAESVDHQDLNGSNLRTNCLASNIHPLVDINSLSPYKKEN